MYAALSGEATSECTEQVLMMRPKPRRFMLGKLPAALRSEIGAGVV